MSKFTVEERAGCVILTGEVSLNAMPHIMRIAHSEAIIATDLARMLGANFVFGTQEDVDALVATIKQRADAAMVQKYGATLSVAACKWLASGERGSSSNTMFTHLAGVDTGDDNCFPWDPADFRRCMLLLKQVPELQSRLPEMAKVSPEWAGLVRDWDQISTSMYLECNDIENPKPGSQATNTYNLIKTAIGQRK